MQLALFRSAPDGTHLPARQWRQLVYYQVVERVLYPATPSAMLVRCSVALYIAPEGLWRLDWTQYRPSYGPPWGLKVWTSPVPKRFATA